MILSFDIGIKNLAYCLMDKEFKIQEWRVCDISANNYDKQCQKIIDEMDKINFPKDKETIVIIEKQPGVNPKMRVISGQIMMYFAIKKKNNPELISKVIFYSPKYKLNCYKPPPDHPIPEKKYSTKYAERKYLSKVHCERLMEIHEENDWKEFYFKHKKKDDLSDCYLQGYAYLKK